MRTLILILPLALLPLLLAACAVEEESVEEKYERQKAAIENKERAYEAQVENEVSAYEAQLENDADAILDAQAGAANAAAAADE